ncbi:MAG TPA: putative lipopolysaccharide heptosyltransferase III [Nitrospira sp.]|nr:putative lipopolysaccharide heptosyltransferase III [Nitrospira sp.]
MTPRNVLTIKLRYLGDVLLATPTLHSLKSAYPGAKLTALVNRGTEDILKGNPDVDEILSLDRGSIFQQSRFVLDIRRRGFDTVVDLTDGDRAAFLTWMSGARVRIGFNAEERWTGRCYTTVVSGRPGAHRINRDLAALVPLGIEAGDGIPQIWLGPEDEAFADQLAAQVGIPRDRPCVVFQPGARYWFKAWPPERFAELGDRLNDRFDCQILVCGSAQEAALAQAVVDRAKSRLLNIAGRSDVRTLAALLKRSALFVGNDTGAMHIAAAVGTPVVGLFGPSNPAEWGPRGARVKTIYKGLDCRVCFHPTCRRGEDNCMKLITVDEVMAAATRQIEDAPRASRRQT